jgi:hypothetical protein
MALKTFELRIHNSRVREALQSGRSNETLFDDSWADTRFVEIQALTSHFARQVAERRYPEDQGFVIEGIEPV